MCAQKHQASPEMTKQSELVEWSKRLSAPFLSDRLIPAFLPTFPDLSGCSTTDNVEFIESINNKPP